MLLETVLWKCIAQRQIYNRMAENKMNRGAAMAS